MRYDVQIPLEGETRWFTVCTCDSADSVAEIVRCLLRHGGAAPPPIMVRARPAD